MIGADFGYRSSNFLGGDTFQGDFYFQRSFSSASGDGNAFGFALTSPNEPWGWDANFIELPTGSVDIHILTATGAINFTPNMGLLLQAPFDNVSDAFGFLSRFRWEYSPGNELFIALGQSAAIASRFSAQRSLFSLRLGRTFRF